MLEKRHSLPWDIPNTDAVPWTFSNLLNIMFKMHLKHLALWPFSLKSHYSRSATWIQGFVSFAFYYILIAFDGRQGQNMSLLLAAGQVICQWNNWTWHGFANGYNFPKDRFMESRFPATFQTDVGGARPHSTGHSWFSKKPLQNL